MGAARNSAKDLRRFRQLLHLMFCGVAFPRNDGVLHVLTLLVLNFQRTAVWPYKLDFELTVAAVQLRVRRVIRQGVLVTNGVADVMENFRQFALKSWDIGPATSKSRESRECVSGSVLRKSHVYLG